ncbi:nuclear transport factor 2 family protein [Christiangramia sp. SM2212]|uniref:Nuclear transport factor 2 family protein n=1 Tax=Christiangramia sediminicola TaxID=3073267 RepID=A0ABU1ENI7_9FLAO|nr:nuclear transport factor 2 family protein [Christiangramia sp. SM2212]MDR5589964.1 nuclear transport factor 2 family protein [Christiangramia sp. SM2212]
MRNFVILMLSFILFTACNDKKDEKIRYTQKSDEINTLKDLLKNYEEADWDTYKTHFADTAKLYYNSRDAIDVETAMATHEENNAALSSYEFPDDKDEFEMVVTDDDETWVNYWGDWQGTIAENDSTVHIPVHITARFVDGKIVAEHVYFDNSGISKALSDLEEARTKDQDSLNQE